MLACAVPGDKAKVTHFLLSDVSQQACRLELNPSQYLLNCNCHCPGLPDALKHVGAGLVHRQVSEQLLVVC